MRLAKIKNIFVYKPDKPFKNDKERSDYVNGSHTYAVYYDKKSKETRLIRTTHLYEKNKEDKIDKKFISVEKFRNMRFPSGVYNGYSVTDINGKNFSYKDDRIKFISKSLPSKQSERIKNFAKKRFK